MLNFSKFGQASAITQICKSTHIHEITSDAIYLASFLWCWPHLMPAMLLCNARDSRLLTCEDKCHIGPLTSCILQVIIFDIVRVIQGAQ